MFKKLFNKNKRKEYVIGNTRGTSPCQWCSYCNEIKYFDNKIECDCNFFNKEMDEVVECRRFNLFAVRETAIKEKEAENAIIRAEEFLKTLDE